MRIATWNVNGLRARLEFVRVWLETRNPDVVGLQELKLTEDQFPFDAFSELGYHVVCHGQKGWNGVAILSRLPLEQDQLGLPGQDDFGSRLVSARIGDIKFTTVYCPNGKNLTDPDFPRKLTWFDDLVSFWSESQSSGELAVLCGDLNIVPSAIDSCHGAKADGLIFHTTEERSRFESLLELGLIDLFRAKNPDSQSFSWWDYRGGAFHRGQGLRIDIVLGTENVMKRVREVKIDREFRKKQGGLTASDHAPVIVDLD